MLELQEIRHEEKAMLEAIPASEWDEYYDAILASMAREKMKILYEGRG